MSKFEQDLVEKSVANIEQSLRYFLSRKFVWTIISKMSAVLNLRNKFLKARQRLLFFIFPTHERILNV